MEQTRIELLQRMPIFGALREDSLLLLLHHAGAAEVKAGDYFFRENDRADSMFVLEAGRVAVIKGWRGRDFVLHSLVAGDCFGEMALMDMFPRSASVRAEAETLLSGRATIVLNAAVFTASGRKPQAQ